VIALLCEDERVGAGRQGLAAWFTVMSQPAMVRFAVRAESLLAATDMVIVPSPVPPGSLVIQEGLPATVHVQAAGAVTVKVAVPPAAAMLALPGVTVDPAHGLAACVMVYELLAMLNVAVREVAAKFDWYVSVTFMLPATLLMLLVTHEGNPVTVHAQVAGAVTATVAVLPLDETLWLAGEIVGAGRQGLPLCETTWLRPAMVRVALRAAPALAAADIEMLAAPVPPETTVSHDGAPETVQLHAVSVESVTKRVAAVPGKEVLVGDNEAVAQGSPACVTTNSMSATTGRMVIVEVDGFAGTE
jgi:hypothetical protein